ncbi:hypothetical protein PROFUN_07370, partial [Planoprotostelium fungivorum]
MTEKAAPVLWGLASYATFRAVSYWLNTRDKARSTCDRIFASPSATVEPCPYPLDYYPGGIDVETPHGSMRAFVFGPLDGKKVLFIHGITTPCPIFKALAHRLAEQGFRVALFGWSECPETFHDDTLYLSQISCLFQKLSWESADVIGYSLGGCLAVALSHHHPTLVQRMVLIAPGGLLSSGLTTKMARVIGAPHRTIRWMISHFHFHKVKMTHNDIVEIIPAKNSEMRDVEVQTDVNSIVSWQIKYNEGFLYALSSA